MLSRVKLVYIHFLAHKRKLDLCWPKKILKFDFFTSQLFFFFKESFTSQLNKQNGINIIYMG